MDIQREFEKHNQINPEERLYLRIGLSAGEPIEEHGDLFGTAVQLAARLCDQAEPSQILISQEVRDECLGEALPLDELEASTPKGFDRATRLYEVKWRSAGS